MKLLFFIKIAIEIDQPTVEMFQLNQEEVINLHKITKFIRKHP